MDMQELWRMIEADLERARNTLPDSAASDDAVREYRDYLDHNELELACDMLESYGEEHTVTREFWIALRDAATKMKLPLHVERYERHATAT
jgi:hypothetical protein